MDMTAFVQLLKNNGAKVNLCSKEDFSPFYVACENGYESIAHQLLNNVAEDNLYSEKGLTPLYEVCENGQENIMELSEQWR